ncbi:MAG: type II/IV secretion system protein [Phycisphaerales bacterium]|nr:type II/IV secretion system protein [Phycisphaerales bacterium]
MNDAKPNPADKAAPPQQGPGAPRAKPGAAPSAASLEVVRAFGQVPVRPEHMAEFAALPGADEEPWDVLLSSLGIEEHAALARLAERCGLRFEPDPAAHVSSETFYERIPANVARRHQVAGLSVEDGVMTVAAGQPMQPAVFQALERMAGMPLEVVLAPRAQVGNLINRGYEQRQDLVAEIVEDMPLDDRAIQSAAGSVSQATDLLQLARQTPVIRLVNMILFEALRRRASDIHIHPLDGRLIIRFRIDGMLIDAFSPPPSLGAAISSRLKVMAELDIANRHSPQDGQTTVRVGSRKIDIRISCIPTIFGERIVLRLLDQTQTQLTLDAVGMAAGMQKQFLDLVERPNGMILVTGPTGSGKTTSLYAALGRVDRTSRNVMTIEDPVEYHLDNISQMQVNPKRGVTFAAGLRSLLRQDPDVILVGEIRDAETANLAIQASLTGHLVLATLHTNDAPSAISRLVDIGLEDYLINSSLLAVLAQRLMRRVCAACQGQAVVPAPAARGGGMIRCEKCFGSGYHGRVAVYELMVMTDDLRRLVAQSADAVAIREAALSQGMRAMTEDARDKIAAGLTTEEELRRVLH